MSEIGLVQIIEGALLAAGRPLTVVQLSELFEEHERPEKSAIREALDEAQARCEGRGFELQEVASGFRYQVRQSLSPWVGRLWHERPQKYSRALLETLALVAYRQPITRGEIEEIRGVAVSTNIIKTLHEREWIRVVGHRDVPGRPAMYATTRQFLDYFSLNALDQLPALAEIRDLETLNAELGFSDPLPGSEPEQASRTESQAESESASGQGDAHESSPGLTVVGGTAHIPAASDEVGDDAADAADAADAEDERGDESSESVTLAEAADDLAARASQSEGGGQADDFEADDSAEENDTELDDYTDSASSKPESQI